MRIGNLEPAAPVVLAPMAGVSEAPFRQICRGMGADVVLSEFLSSEALRRRIKNTLEGAEFEEHWAFVAPVKKTPPQVPGDAWSDFLPGSEDLVSDWVGKKCGNFNNKTGKCGS